MDLSSAEPAGLVPGGALRVVRMAVGTEVARIVSARTTRSEAVYVVDIGCWGAAPRFDTRGVAA